MREISLSERSADPSKSPRKGRLAFPLANSALASSPPSREGLGVGLSSAFLRMLRMRAYVYCMNGPVLPLKSMLSSGLKSIFLRASTLRMKYLRAPRPTMRAISCASASEMSSSLLTLSLLISRASSIIFSIKSSASTTVPSRLFILPLGSSTMP